MLVWMLVSTHVRGDEADEERRKRNEASLKPEAERKGKGGTSDVDVDVDDVLQLFGPARSPVEITSWKER